VHPLSSYVSRNFFYSRGSEMAKSKNHTIFFRSHSVLLARRPDGRNDGTRVRGQAA
jgi:hypothetical protein